MRKVLSCLFSGVLALGIVLGVALGVTDATASESEAARFFSATENAEVYVDYHAPEHIGDYQGIFVKAKDNGDSSVTLNYELDLRMFTAEDTIVQLIPITTEPKQAKGDLELSGITVRLTDVEDENVFVEMYVQRNPDPTYPYSGYASARGNGQLLTGRHFNDKEEITYYSANNYGRSVSANFYGRARAGQTIEKDIRPMSFAFDYDTSCVHTDKTVTHAYKDTIIADLTDSENMKGTWTGFKSGIVKMTITASSENYSNKNSGFMILNFGGLNLAEDGWTDNEAPFFKIDTLGYDIDELPDAEVFMRYPVYEAIAFDKFDGVYGSGSAERDVTVTVNKEGSTTPIHVQDGYFIPTETGVYEINYTAVDTAGNVATKTLKIKANNVAGISHEWATPMATSVTVGIKTLIPQHIVYGTYGEYSLTTRVYENATGKECEIKNGGFLTEKDGLYTVEVTVKDFLGRENVFNYYVTAKARKVPVLDSIPTIPAMMILGKETSLPDFEAYDYYSLTGQKTKAEKYYLIKNENGELIKKVKPNEKFTPDASFGETVTVEYVAKSYLYEDSIGDIQSVSILNNQGDLDFSKYFVASNVSGMEGNYLGKSCIAYFFEDDTASIAYGMPLAFSGMDFAFRVPKDKNNYETIHMTLTDSMQANRQVVLTIQASSDNDFSDFYVNGEKVGKICGTFDDTKLEDFLIKINARNEIIDEQGNLVCQVTHYLTGEAFEGFSENICYAEFTFSSVSGESAIQFVRSGRQYFDANTKQDYIAPLIALYGVYTSEQPVGTITLPGAIAVDAVCGKTDVYVEIYTEAGDLVYKTKVGSDPVSFTIKNSGRYSVKYTSKDDSIYTMPAKVENILCVYAVESFEVSMLGEVATTAKKGETIQLPMFVVDSKITSYDAVVFVMKPKGGKEDVTESMSFVADQSGVYKVYYYVVYEIENSYLYHLAEYVINVA